MLTIFLFLASPAYAGPFAKFGRGITNIFFSPLEIILQMDNLAKDNDKATAYTGGVFKGLGMMLVRIGGGVYELATFPLPLPLHYEPLFNKPTVLDDLRPRMERTHAFDPLPGNDPPTL